MFRTCVLTLVIFTNQLLAQSFGSNSKLEVGLGYIPLRLNSVGISRLTVALNDLETGNSNFGLGLYSTAEYRSDDFFNPGQPYFRMPIGITKRFNNFLGVFTGMDFVYWIKSGYQYRRSEFGATILLNNLVNLRIGYSKYVGTSIGLGFQMNLMKRS